MEQVPAPALQPHPTPLRVLLWCLEMEVRLLMLGVIPVAVLAVVEGIQVLLDLILQLAVVVEVLGVPVELVKVGTFPE